jgi:hypothetical protein
VLLETLWAMGVKVPDLEPLDRLIVSSREIERRYDIAVQ